MASRLSEETLKGILDAGHQGLLVQNPTSAVELAPLTVDLDQLLLAEDPEAAVQAVAPQVLFQSLLAIGPEDALEILPLLSNEQVQRLLDYDGWHEDRLEPRKVIRWMNLFKEVSDEELARRFSELEEEYQLALLGPIIDLVEEEEFDKMGSGQQDELHELPCHTLHYRVKSEDPVVVEFVHGLVEAMLGRDVNYAYSMLAHAAGLPPNESEASLIQFRQARLTEDGFATYEESLAAFMPLDLAQLEQKWAFALHHEGLIAAAADSRTDQPFLARVLALPDSGWTPEAVDDLRQRLGYLANTLCAAAQVEPDDGRGIREVLRHSQALVGLGLEHLARSDERAASGILREEHPQTLFRAGLSLVRRLAEVTLRLGAHFGLPEADQMPRLLHLDRRGALAVMLERTWQPLIGFEATETIKGMINRFPVRPLRLERDERGAARMVYAPIASRAALRQLATEVDQITGQLFLASLVDQAGVAMTLPIERQLMTALARASCGGELSSAPLSASEMESLYAAVRSEHDLLSPEVRSGIEGSLRLALIADGPTQSWAASRHAGIVATDSTTAVMDALHEIENRLSLGLRHAAETSGDERAFAALVAGLIEVSPSTLPTSAEQESTDARN